MQGALTAYAAFVGLLLLVVVIIATAVVASSIVTAIRHAVAKRRGTRSDNDQTKRSEE
jgi:uncharacterized protein YejL (UPF0352 family)